MKSAHIMDSRDVEVGENQQVDHVYIVDSWLKSSGRWWKNFLEEDSWCSLRLG